MNTNRKKQLSSGALRRLQEIPDLMPLHLVPLKNFLTKSPPEEKKQPTQSPLKQLQLWA